MNAAKARAWRCAEACVFWLVCGLLLRWMLAAAGDCGAAALSRLCMVAMWVGRSCCRFVGDVV